MSDMAVPSVPPLHPRIDPLSETIVWVGSSPQGARQSESEVRRDEDARAEDDEAIRVDVKVAASPSEHRRGLMQVEHLPDGVGMLFVFDGWRQGGFWMFDTPTPLDVAFLDDDGRILDILAMEPCVSSSPEDCPSYNPEVAYVAALEVRQGWFAERGISPGHHAVWTGIEDRPR